MGTVVTYAARPDLAPLRMSNGLTAVCFSVLALAASARATSDRQRALAVWVASNDQEVFGRGAVRFDLGDIPWCPETFVEDKAFLLQVVDAASARCGWARLDFEPSAEALRPSLAHLRDMLAAFTPEHVERPGGVERAGAEVHRMFEKCLRHGVYLHAHGCIVCNDG